jgi:hypothetical protein
MSRRSIPLAARVRYEGRAQIFDRRAKIGADLEKLPDPVWRTISHTLRTHFQKAAPGQVVRQPATEDRK